ncbi:MAG: hypothetical protein V3U75_06420 [Methylococcaceae bacterium]
MGSGADKENEICTKSPDNRHNYQKDLNSRETSCIYCSDVLTTEAEQRAGIKTGDALLNEIPGIHEIPGNEKVKTQTAPKCPGRPPLDNLGINTLTGAFEMYGRIMAIQARVDGMNVRNMCNHLNGNFPEYRQADFIKAADNITQIVQQLNIMKHCNVVQ